MARSSTTWTPESLKGNTFARKWDPEELIKQFELAIEEAKKNDEILCLYDAVDQTDLPLTTYDWYASKDPVLGALKRECQKQISRRINKSALKGEFSSAPAIWRMKQLGERDEVHNVTENVNYNTVVTKKEAKKISDALEEDY